MAMELDHSFTVPVPPDQAWDVLLDVQKIAPCMPGAQVDGVEGDDVAGRLKVRVGPVSLTYKGTASFTDRDAAERSILVEASGKEMRGAGTASATVRAALSPDNGSGDESTLVTMHTTLNVTGRPAQFGRGVIAEVGSRLIDKFADNLAQQLTGGGPAAEAPLAGAAVPATGSPAASAAAVPGAPPVPPPSAAAEAGTGTTAGAGETTGTGEPPAAPPAAATQVPVRSVAAPQATVRTVPEPVPPATAPDQEDSLDLLSLVGPVIVKRLAPVVGAAVAAGLITWGVRRIVRGRRQA
ncbi:MAG: SRPBCC family protein [Streptosporangiaceae bacterium]